MILEIKVYETLCELEIFRVNGVDGDYDDFGIKEDIHPDGSYGCGNMCFVPKLPTNKILDKYKITADEYLKICEKLEDVLHFGCCGWCD